MKKSYLDYTVEELAQADDFIRWVRDADDDLAKDWQAWLKAYPEQKDKVAEAKNLLSAIQSLRKSPSQELRDTMWANIEKATLKEALVRDLAPAKQRSWRKIAAAIILPLSIGLLVYLSTRDATLTQAVTSVGEVIEHELPDGSMVYLNAVSEVSYDEKNWEDHRKLSLDGEAYFEVKKGSKFSVLTQGGEVEVLGTSFNVISRGAEFRVACYSGRVRVTASEDAIADLEPGQASFKKKDQLFLKPLKNENDIEYRQHLHHFDAEPLRNVFSELERQYDVSVVSTNEVDARPYTGFFMGQDIDKAIYSICWPMKLHCELKGKEVMVKPKAE